MCCLCTNGRSGTIPPQYGKEFSQDHRRGAPDLDPGHMKRRNGERPAVAGPFRFAEKRRVEQLINIDIEDARDLAVGWQERWPCFARRSDRMQAEAADRDVQRG